MGHTNNVKQWAFLYKNLYEKALTLKKLIRGIMAFNDNKRANTLIDLSYGSCGLYNYRQSGCYSYDVNK